jgi:hypothetical protein
MQLDEFISETLKAIIKGTKDAQEFAKANRGIVNPKMFGKIVGAEFITIENALAEESVFCRLILAAKPPTSICISQCQE